MSKAAEQIAADYQRSVPNTNSLSERRAAAHKRNVEQQRYIAEAVEATPATELKHLTAKEYGYASGIKLLEPLVLRIEELERDVRFLKEQWVNAAAPK